MSMPTCACVSPLNRCQAVIRQLVTRLRYVLTQRGPREGSTKWRDMEQYFRHPDFCKEFSSGVLDLSVAWQMQGHEVRDAFSASWHDP